MEDPFPSKESDDAEKARIEIERQRYEKIMATKDGRWVMWRTLNSLGTFDPTYSDREAGSQASGMLLMNHLRDVNTELYHQMIVENDR